MKKQVLFTGAGVALITPMHPDGSINFEKLEELVEWQIANSTDALIVCGTTGEAPTLSSPEHLEALRVAIDRAAHRIPVIAGTGSNDTAHCIDMCRTARRMGADGLLLVTPYYNKTSQRGADCPLHQGGGLHRPAADSVQCPLPHRLEYPAGNDDYPVSKH